MQLHRLKAGPAVIRLKNEQNFEILSERFIDIE